MNSGNLKCSITGNAFVLRRLKNTFDAVTLSSSFHQISDFQSERLENGAHVANGFGFESFVMRRSCQPSSLAYMEKKFEAVQVAPGHPGILHLGL